MDELALAILLYGGEIWALKEKNKKRLASIETKFFGRRTGFTLFEHKMNEAILEELKAEPADAKLRRHKSKGLRHATE